VNEGQKSVNPAKKEATVSAPATKPAEAKIYDPVVERQKAQDERPYVQLEHRPPRKGVSQMGVVTGTGGPQPPEVMEEIFKTHVEATAMAEAKAEVRAELETEERNKQAEKKQAKLKEAAEAREKLEKDIEAKAKERVEKKKEAEKKAAEAKKKEETAKV
jgi:hypothetical protein